MLDLDKTELRENVLIITNDDGTIVCIPEEGATISEKEMFAEFREKLPLGKENYKFVNGEPIELTEAEKLALQPTIVTPVPSDTERINAIEEVLKLIL